jgi:phosphatidylglycerophosphate synthase
LPATPVTALPKVQGEQPSGMEWRSREEKIPYTKPGIVIALSLAAALVLMALAEEGFPLQAAAFIAWIGFLVSCIWIVAVSDRLAEDARPKDGQSRPRFPRAALTLIIFCGLAFLVTLHTEGLPTMFHYLALLVAPIALGAGLAERYGRSWLPWAGGALGIIAACVWWQFDYYVHYWNKDVLGVVDEDGDPIVQTFSDWIWRSRATPFYREVDWSEDGSWHTLIVRFSDSGKRHGENSHSIWPLDQEGKERYRAQGYEIGVLGADLHEWYWYGEKITEGEWHLRNK